jgi:hypothetical protein
MRARSLVRRERLARASVMDSSQPPSAAASGNSHAGQLVFDPEYSRSQHRVCASALDTSESALCHVRRELRPSPKAALVRIRPGTQRCKEQPCQLLRYKYVVTKRNGMVEAFPDTTTQDSRPGSGR